MDKPHKKLDLWNTAMELAVNIYQVTDSFPREERYSLTDQIRRAVSRSLWKNCCGTVEIQWPAHLGQQENTAQDAQTGRPARPQRAKRRRRTLRYVEPLSEARTPLADFFSILLAFQAMLPRELVGKQKRNSSTIFTWHKGRSAN